MIDEIIWAVKIVVVYDFIMNLFSGYNIMVGERGVFLLGG